MSGSTLYHSIIEDGKEEFQKKLLLTPGLDIGNIIDLTASSRIKLHPIRN